jgi:hypothetical protein
MKQRPCNLLTRLTKLRRFVSPATNCLPYETHELLSKFNDSLFRRLIRKLSDKLNSCPTLFKDLYQRIKVKTRSCERNLSINEFYLFTRNVGVKPVSDLRRIVQMNAKSLLATNKKRRSKTVSDIVKTEYTRTHLPSMYSNCTLSKVTRTRSFRRP